MKTQTQNLSIVMLAITAAILVGGSFAGATLAAKQKDTQTINNAKQIILKNGQETFVINVNSIPGANGKNGQNGQNGTAGVPGRDGTNGTNGKDGVNGTTAIIVCTTNSTNAACGNTPVPTPTPVPVTNGTGNSTGNVTQAHHK
jgi:hypothetical protein